MSIVGVYRCKMASRTRSLGCRIRPRNPSVFTLKSFHVLADTSTCETASKYSLNCGEKGRKKGLFAWRLCTGILAIKSHGVHNPSSSDSTVHATLLGPSVRRLLDTYGLETNLISPSGQKGQLLKVDVLKYIDKHSVAEIDFKAKSEPEIFTSFELKHSAQDSLVDYVDLDLSSMRKTIAKRVTESKTTIPHIYSTINCSMDKVFAVRKKLKENGVAVSVNDFIIKAVGLALRHVPELNVSWSNEGPLALQTVNVAVAVASPNGLTTPVVFGADELDLQSISLTVRELSQRAKHGQLKLNELQGGSFTISNLGMFGVKNFTAVVYPEQAGILAVGQTRVSVGEDRKTAREMTVTLCHDGRVVDELIASQWLKKFQDLIENPLLMGL